jgi:hypothetical protein
MCVGSIGFSRCIVSDQSRRECRERCLFGRTLSWTMSKRGPSSLVNRRQWVAGRPNWVSSWPCSLVMLSLGNRLTSISSWLVEHEELEARGKELLPHFSLNRYSMATTLGGHRLCVSWYLMPADCNGSASAMACISSRWCTHTMLSR